MSTPVTPALEPASWYERRVVLADSIVAVIAFGLLGILGANTFGVVYGAIGFVIPLSMCAALTIRRTRPVPYVVVTAVLAILEMAFMPVQSGAPTDVLVLVAVHTAARYGPVWFGYAACALASVGGVWAAYYWIVENRLSAEGTALLSVIIAIAVMIGVVLISYALGRAQRAKVRAIAAQVAALGERNRLLQHEHEQQLRLATEEERGRLAAETHDILAHSLAVIVAQADGAAMLVAKDPARAQQAIEQIGDTSREALDEIRLKVAALRRGEDPTSTLAPARSLRDLPSLVDNVRRAGLPVELICDGDLQSVPAGASLSGYRIVQEALTNTLKHAGPGASATVRISRSPGELRLTIEDDGRGTTSTDGEGNGLRGMRTRVDQYGGVLDAGPRIGGGFAVRASIPLTPVPAS